VIWLAIEILLNMALWAWMTHWLVARYAAAGERMTDTGNRALKMLETRIR
jgi:hypothetical protein